MHSRLTDAGSRPLVSIVIPTYNHGHLIGAALESVRSQSYENWEAIVINNYSSDNTVEVVNGFGDGRFRLVDFRNNGIIAASRNRGIELAHGEIIAFLDSDDIWYPRKLEHCLARMQQGYDLVCHGERWVEADGSTRDVVYGPERRATYRSLLYDGNCISTSAVVVRRSAVTDVGAFSESAAIVTAEDYDLWARLARHGCRIGFVPEILGEYRLHGGNQSRAALRNMDATLAVVDRLLADEPCDTVRDRLLARRSRAIPLYAGARMLHADQQYGQALKLYLAAWLSYPLFPKTYAGGVLSLLGFICGRGRNSQVSVRRD